jgi:hypothetical protein
MVASITMQSDGSPGTTSRRKFYAPRAHATSVSHGHLRQAAVQQVTRGLGQRQRREGPVVGPLVAFLFNQRGRLSAALREIIDSNAVALAVARARVMGAIGQILMPEDVPAANDRAIGKNGRNGRESAPDMPSGVEIEIGRHNLPVHDVESDSAGRARPRRLLHD